MNKSQRIEAAIKGEAVDRIPFSVWYHLSAFDQDPVSLAEETAALTKKYDYDFVKMMPFGLYGVQDLGARVNIFSQQGQPPLGYMDRLIRLRIITTCVRFRQSRAPMANSWSSLSCCVSNCLATFLISRRFSVR